MSKGGEATPACACVRSEKYDNTLTARLVVCDLPPPIKANYELHFTRRRDDTCFYLIFRIKNHVSRRDDSIKTIRFVY